MPRATRPISAAAFGFLKLVSLMQGWVFTDLPEALGFHGTAVWWPLLLLAVAGVLVALTIWYLPGKGGESPAEGFKPRRAPLPIELPGIALAALATLSFGVVLGPEAPLIALGGGLAVYAVRLAKRDAPSSATAVLASAGSFAAISTLLGSPILGAFLLMEVSGLGGPMLGLVLVPGLLAAGIGSLIFTGLDAWTGFGTFSLALPDLPKFVRPDLAEFGWALVIGVAAALLGTGIRRLALLLRPYIERRIVLLTPVVGLIVAGLAIAYAEATGKSSSDVLFSGQTALGPLVSHSADYSRRPRRRTRHAQPGADRPARSGTRMPGRADGGRSFDSSSSNDGPGEERRSRCVTRVERPHPCPHPFSRGSSRASTAPAMLAGWPRGRTAR
jgi:chloride channel protein, CIC family